MAFTNNVMIVRHKLLAQLVRLWNENRLLDEIDRLPLELSPRKSKVIGRCCVHKERAVWKYKSFPLLGFDMSDGVFGAVHVAATGYTSTAKVGDFVIDLYTRRACFINYA